MGFTFLFCFYFLTFDLLCIVTFTGLFEVVFEWMDWTRTYTPTRTRTPPSLKHTRTHTHTNTQSLSYPHSYTHSHIFLPRIQIFPMVFLYLVTFLPILLPFLLLLSPPFLPSFPLTPQFLPSPTLTPLLFLSLSPAPFPAHLQSTHTHLKGKYWTPSMYKGYWITAGMPRTFSPPARQEKEHVMGEARWEGFLRDTTRKLKLDYILLAFSCVFVCGGVVCCCLLKYDLLRS